MFLFSAINATTSGPGAQSSAFGDIGVDVGNGQTMGFESVGTSLFNYQTFSMATENVPPTAFARRTYFNGVQASITQPDSPFDMAAAGPGFFAASQSTSIATVFSHLIVARQACLPKATVVSISTQTPQTTLTVVA
jgi:hypothetical protein